MPRVVLDTNLFVSALFWRGNPYKVLIKCLNNELQLAVSEEILKEVERVIKRTRK